MLRSFYVVKWVCGILAVSVFPAVNSTASSVIYQFGPVGPPEGPPVQATFQDTGANTVLLSITSPVCDNSGFLTDLYFNFDPADNVKHLRFKHLDGSPGRLPVISTGANVFQADGGYYDIHLDFDKPNDGKFSEKSSTSYLLKECGLNALDFAFPDSTGRCSDSPGTDYALADIQGPCGNDQWLVGNETLQPVPEPGFASLLGMALGLWSVVRFRKRARLSSPQVKAS